MQKRLLGMGGRPRSATLGLPGKCDKVGGLWSQPQQSLSYMDGGYGCQQGSPLGP